jgi:hypothetical protein
MSIVPLILVGIEDAPYTFDSGGVIAANLVGTLMARI